MIRLLAATALSLSLTAPLHAFDLNNMSETDRAAFGDAVRAYLMENPQVIMDAVQALEAQQAATQADRDAVMVAENADALLNDGFSWVGGNPEGDVTVVEFLDYRCGYCRRAHDEVAELLESDGNIRIIVKELPILGEASLLSSQFAIAVKQIEGDAAYKTAHDALITFTGDVSERALRRLSDSLGFDSDAVIARMESDEVAQEIAQTRELAQRLQINGTPTFVMGDQLVRGYVPLDGMRQIVSAERG